MAEDRERRGGAAAIMRPMRPRDVPTHDDAVDRTLFASPLVTIGRFRCPAEHPRFVDSGPSPGCMFVFPRTAVWIQHDGASPFVADSNVVTFYNPGQHYTRQRLSRDGDCADWYLVAPELMREVAGRFDASTAERPHAPLPFSHGPADSRLYLAQRCVFEHVAHARVVDPLFVEEAVVSILNDVVGAGFALGASSRAARQRAERRRQQLAEDARAALALRFASSQSLVQLAQSLRVSPFHLARVFRRYTGTSLHEYRLRLRLRAALQGLARPTADILDLALGLGFSSHSHFTAVFRTRFGVTPSELRAHATRDHLRGMAHRLLPADA